MRSLNNYSEEVLRNYCPHYKNMDDSDNICFTRGKCIDCWDLAIQKYNDRLLKTEVVSD